jgi:branched-chain amino acid transport system substrate-binding protein
MQRPITLFASLLLFMFVCGTAIAKETVKLAFIGPLTWDVSANGPGGRNSADHRQPPQPRSSYLHESVPAKCA